MAMIVFFLLLVFVGAATNDRVQVQLFFNGEERGQNIWLSRSAHFPNLSTFNKLMEGLVENGMSNLGYVRPIDFEARVYRQDGLLIQRWKDIEDGDSLYVVPFDTIFMWPGVSIGHRVNVSSLLFPNYDVQIELETLSITPRIFRIRSLFKPQECEELIKINTGNMTRSAVGKALRYVDTEVPVYNRRTSSSSFDVSSPLSRTLISRMFSLLRMPERDAIEDGLQVVRYAENEAYDVHTDFFPLGSDPTLNFDPKIGGSNRYATIFAFLTDDFEGGETVFPHVPRDGRGKTPLVERNADDGNWTATMTEGVCSNSLAVHPVRGDAALFYSMTNSGRMDPLTEHGGCPVLNGTKYGANLWVWNRGKFGSYTQYEAMFLNELSVSVEVSYFNPRQDPVLTPMMTIPAEGTASILGHRGDMFVARAGSEWVGVFHIDESHTVHLAFRISKPKVPISHTFEYYVGLHAGREQAEAGKQEPSSMCTQTVPAN